MEDMNLITFLLLIPPHSQLSVNTSFRANVYLISITQLTQSVASQPVLSSEVCCCCFRFKGRGFGALNLAHFFRTYRLLSPADGNVLLKWLWTIGEVGLAPVQV